MIWSGDAEPISDHLGGTVWESLIAWSEKRACRGEASVVVTAKRKANKVARDDCMIRND